MVLVGLGSLLGASWADLEASWGFRRPLGVVLAFLRVILEPLEAVLVLIGVVLGPLEAVLGPLGMVLGGSWPPWWSLGGPDSEHVGFSLVFSWFDHEFL